MPQSAALNATILHSWSFCIAAVIRAINNVALRVITLRSPHQAATHVCSCQRTINATHAGFENHNLALKAGGGFAQECRCPTRIPRSKRPGCGQTEQTALELLEMNRKEVGKSHLGGPPEQLRFEERSRRLRDTLMVGLQPGD